MANMRCAPNVELCRDAKEAPSTAPACERSAACAPVAWRRVVRQASTRSVCRERCRASFVARSAVSLLSASLSLLVVSDVLLRSRGRGVADGSD